MGELRQRARELAEKLDRDLNSQKSFTVDPVIHIESALLRFAVEVLKAEPDDIEVDAANRLQWEDTYSYRNVFRAMAAARAREIKEGK